MPHGQEQVIRGRKVKLSPVMVYSTASPYQGEKGRVKGEGKRGGGGELRRADAVATKLPLDQFWRLSAQEPQI